MSEFSREHEKAYIQSKCTVASEHPRSIPDHEGRFSWKRISHRDLGFKYRNFERFGTNVTVSSEFSRFVVCPSGPTAHRMPSSTLRSNSECEGRGQELKFGRHYHHLTMRRGQEFGTNPATHRRSHNWGMCRPLSLLRFRGHLRTL